MTKLIDSPTIMRSARIFLPSLGTKACAVPGPCSGLASYICSRGSHEFVCTSDLFDETVVACCLKMSSRPHGFGMTAELQRKVGVFLSKFQCVNIGRHTISSGHGL